MVYTLLNFVLTVVLWAVGFGHWVKHLTRGQVNPETWTDCKLYFYLFYIGRHYSSTLLILMSVEKCFAIYFLLISKTVCTVRTAKWATGITGIVLASYDTMYLLSIESRFYKPYGRQICFYLFELKSIRLMSKIDSALYSFGPFILMFITNFAIVFKFMRAKCGSNSTESTNQALAKVATRGTAMVVTVSVTFLVLTTPTAVWQAIPDTIHLGRNPLFHAFMNFGQYLNHSINGVLYTVVGSWFRRELLNLICRKERNDGTSTSRSPNRGVVIITGNRK